MSTSPKIEFQIEEKKQFLLLEKLIEKHYVIISARIIFLRFFSKTRTKFAKVNSPKGTPQISLPRLHDPSIGTHTELFRLRYIVCFSFANRKLKAFSDALRVQSTTKKH